MKILFIAPVYNEMSCLPYQYKHCMNNNIDMFILDNMSTDTTKYFLQENNIPHSQIDTKGSFNLTVLIESLNKIVHDIKPDWFIYGAGDMFYESKDGLRSIIEESDKFGYSQIEMNVLHIENVGDYDKDVHPFKYYTYCLKRGCSRVLISKYNPLCKIMVDNIYYPNVAIKRKGGIIFEMRATKNTEFRMETLHRRKKAWSEGLNKSWGEHYELQAKHNFIFNKSDCLDIRKMPEYYLYQRLEQL